MRRRSALILGAMLGLSVGWAHAQQGVEPTGTYTASGQDTQCGNLGMTAGSFDAAFDALKAYTHACPDLASLSEDTCSGVTEVRKRLTSGFCNYVYTKIAGDHVGGSVSWVTACPKDTVQNMATGLCGPIPPEPPKSCPRPDGVEAGNPLIPSTGEKTLDHNDHEGHGLHALSFTRSYRSSRVAGAATGAATAGLGQPWSHNHTHVLRQSGTAGTAGSTVRIFFADGSVRVFGWDVASSSWKPSNSADVLAANPTGLQYKSLDNDSLWQFDATGRLLTVTQRNGWVTTYTYSTAATPVNIAPVAGLLLTVRNHFGRALSFVYNASRQLASVTAPDGRVVSYTYDSTAATGRLSTVSYPGPTSGTVSKTYLYENTSFPQLLTGIIDEKGNRLATYAYDSQGRGTSTQHAGGADLHTISYGAAGVATVTDPLGTQRTYNYGGALGQLAVLGADKPSGTGNRSAASRVQDANGFITQETDFLGVNTMRTWDINRRLPLTTTEAAASPEARTTTTQWHATYRLPVLVTESGRSTAYTYDSAGNKLSQTVTDTATSVSRTASWTYGTQGLLATAVAPGGVVAQTYAYYTNTAFSGTYDPYIDQVSLLLHGNGANGATVFTDSGRVPKVLTASGNAQISTAQSKYGTASLLLDGVGDYLTTPTSADYEFGTGDFTIETWVYIAALPAAGGASQAMASVWDATGSKRSWQFLYRQTAGNVHNIIFSLSSNGSTSSSLITTWTPSAGTWYHIAVARQSGTTTIYLNGTSLGSNGTVTGAPYVSGRPMTIGALGDSASIGHFLNGYLDDFRITKGVARYTANFTPPAQELSHNGPSPESTGHTTGDLQSVTNAVGHVTQFTLYDRAGRMRQMVDPKGVVTDLLYSPRGLIASVTVTPPGGTARTTTYTYDNAGQLTGATLPDGSTLGYSYDAAQRLTGVTDAKGNTVTYTLDAMGNKVGEQVKDPQGNLQRNITRVYDALNRVQQVTGVSN